jgi:MFS family permease
MTGFALGVSVYLESRSAVGFAMVILCLYLPSIVLRPVGGVLADRLDRRFIMAAGDIGSALGVLFLLSSLTADSLVPWKIFVGVAVTSAFSAIEGPAYKASVADLLDDNQYSRAGGLIQLSSSAQHLVAPLAAGLLLSLGGLHTVLLLDISTYAIGVGTVLAVRRRMRPAEPEMSGSKERLARTRADQVASRGIGRFFSEMRAGWRTLSSNSELFRIVVKISAVTFFVGVLQTLFGPMMLSIASAEKLGLIQSFGATGMVASSLVLGIIELKQHGRLLRIGLLAAGLSLVVLGLSPVTGVITVSLLGFYTSLPFINTSAEVLLRRGIPIEQQGRAWGLIGFVSQLGYIFAYLSAGFAADHVFTPALNPGGFLSTTIGLVIGVGSGRGIAFLLLLCGLGIIIVATIGGNTRTVPRWEPTAIEPGMPNDIAEAIGAESE